MATPHRMSGPVISALSDAAQQLGELKSDRVVVALEKQILSGKLQPGSRLPTEDELCAILGVSRSVVRDSVRMLVARGLLVVRQGSGTTVAEPNDTAFTNALLVLLSRSGLSMGDVTEARAVLESTSAALAATNGTEEDWQILEKNYETLEKAAAEGDDEAAARAHSAFHNQILQAVHQPALKLILKPMNEVTLVTSAASVRRSYPEDWEVASHLPILEALKARDVDAAVAAVAAHYEVYRLSPQYKEYLWKKFSDAFFDEPALS